MKSETIFKGANHKDLTRRFLPVLNCIDILVVQIVFRASKVWHNWVWTDDVISASTSVV